MSAAIIFMLAVAALLFVAGCLCFKYRRQDAEGGSSAALLGLVFWFLAFALVVIVALAEFGGRT